MKMFDNENQEGTAEAIWKTDENWVHNNNILKDFLSEFHAKKSNSIYKDGRKLDERKFIFLDEKGNTLCDAEDLKFYSNNKEREIRCVIKNCSIKNNGFNEKEKNIIISIPFDEYLEYQKKYYGTHNRYGTNIMRDLICPIIINKIKQMNVLFNCDCKKLTGVDGTNLYDITPKQIAIRGNDIFQPISDKRFYRIGNLAELPEEAYVLVGNGNMFEYKPSYKVEYVFRSKMMEILASVPGNKKDVEDIMNGLQKCCKKADDYYENNNKFVKVNTKKKKCKDIFTESFVKNFDLFDLSFKPTEVNMNEFDPKFVVCKNYSFELDKAGFYDKMEENNENENLENSSFANYNNMNSYQTYPQNSFSYNFQNRIIDQNQTNDLYNRLESMESFFKNKIIPQINQIVPQTNVLQKQANALDNRLKAMENSISNITSRQNYSYKQGIELNNRNNELSNKLKTIEDSLNNIMHNQNYNRIGNNQNNSFMNTRNDSWLYNQNYNYIYDFDNRKRELREWREKTAAELLRQQMFNSYIPNRIENNQNNSFMNTRNYSRFQY